MVDHSEEEEAQAKHQQVAQQLALYGVGFVRLREQDNVEDGIPAGTGTLVSIGATKGVLTAAHVLSELPDDGEVGIMRVGINRTLVQRLKINMGYQVKHCWTSSHRQPDSADVQVPDIGFLKLNPIDVATIESSHSFFNLDIARCEDLLAHAVSPNIGEVIFGVVHEWSEELPPFRPDTRRLGFNTMFASGTTSRWRTVGEFDICDFSLEPELRPTPRSFEGMSGGALWRMAAAKATDVIDFRKALAGVIYWQSGVGTQEHRITCHGIASIQLVANNIRSKYGQ